MIAVVAKRTKDLYQVIIMNPEPQDAQPPLIYLNNAATTWPKPDEVLEEAAQCLRQPLYEPGRTTGNGSMDYPSAARQALAPFFHAGLLSTSSLRRTPPTRLTC
jgi:selenocysteine lyase/cysteine desulfurase